MIRIRLNKYKKLKKKIIKKKHRHNFPAETGIGFQTHVSLQIKILSPKTPNSISEKVFMDSKKAGSSLDSLISSFNARITQLQELVIARNSEFNTFNFNSTPIFYFFFCNNSHRNLNRVHSQCTRRAASPICRRWMLR